MIELNANSLTLGSEPIGGVRAVMPPGLDLRWFATSRTRKSPVALTAILVASVALHGILAFGVDWVDSLVTEQKSTAEQEVPVEVVEKIPDERTSEATPVEPPAKAEIETAAPSGVPPDPPVATPTQQAAQQPTLPPPPPVPPLPTPVPSPPEPALPAATGAPAQPVTPAAAPPDQPRPPVEAARPVEVQRPALPDGPSKAADAPPPSAAPLPNAAGIMFLPDSFRMVATAQTPVASKEELDSYKNIVFDRVVRERQFPEAARRRKANGVALVSFVLDAAGNLAGVSLLRSTGDRDLDAEAIAMVKRSAPFPKPPPGALLTFTPLIEFGQDD